MEEILNNRMYRRRIPERGDICVCKVIETCDGGSIVELLEYGGMQGMIAYSEMSRKRITNISKLVNIGKIICGEALNIDDVKYYVDLSKKSVREEEMAAAEEKYEKSRRVHNILKRLSEKTNIPRIEIYERWVWDWGEKYGHADNVLKLIAKDGFSCPPEISPLVELCKHAYKPKKVNMSGKVELSCFGPGGIDSIKSVLNKVKSEYPELKVNLIAHPLFLIHTSADEDGIEVMEKINDALDAAVKYIKLEEGGEGVVKERAKIRIEDVSTQIKKLVEKEIEDDSDSE